jgi:outer membrane receptor protein involved in Fe transport
MFVGEDLNVLSIASRREESARQAPAVASVITRQMLETNGAYTLSQALAQMPGFYMGQKEWGTQPYLRGIPDSVLLLHDTVPLSSDMTKSVHSLDDDLSLAGIKRIEIIRGPGSVLWGADAYAGIVNMVPLTGKDVNGVETGVHYGSPGSQSGFYVNTGHDGGKWDAFLSVSGREADADDRTANVVSFWGDNDTDLPVPPEDRYGYARADRPHYLEFNGNANLGDFLTLSGRFSDYSRPYTMSEENNELSWVESRSTPINYVKLDGKKNLDSDSLIRYTGYYSSINSTYKVIDLEFSPEEYTLYNELVYDQNFFTGKGQLTTGAAFRRKQVHDAPIWDSYLPDYLGEDNTTVLPGITQEDYRTDLWSMFGQYSHKIGNADVSFGARHDEHEAYKDRTSYNAGVVWPFIPRWNIKALYGTAYRTPFARQLLEAQDADLEEINTTSVELSWMPAQNVDLSVCGFINRIEDHILEDPYAGLSIPNHQKIEGIELEGLVRPVDRVELGANVTVFDNSGPDETYRFVDYIFIRPDGSEEPHYAELSYPYNPGPDAIYNMTGKWSLTDRITLFGRAGYFSSQKVICPRCETRQTVPGVWLVDAKLTVRDIWSPGIDLDVFVWNLADKEYLVPGTYSTIEGEPFETMIMISKRW